MKPFLLSLFLLLSVPVLSQTAFSRFVNRNKITWSLIAVAGVADGVNQAINHDYAAFQRTFPDANDDFWNPAVSWKNKYKNHDSRQGEAFIGSTTLLVSFTDGNHLTRMINHTCLIGGIAIRPWGQKEKWYWYVADFAASMLVYKGTMTLTYEMIRK